MLFEVVNRRAVPSVHALLIEPFKTIWESDTTPEKTNATKLFTYFEFVCSPKKSNPFIGYAEEIRPKKVKKEVYGDENYRTTDFMILGVAKYKQLINEASPTNVLFDAALNAKDKLVNYLNTVNLEERTNAGTAVTKPADVTRALKDIPDVAKSILASREKVHSELMEDAKTRNQREIGQYEE